MSRPSPPPELAGSQTAVRDRAALDATGRSGRGRSWPWVVLGIVLTALKVQAFAAVFAHRVEAIAAFGLLLALSVLRIRLIGVAIGSAALFALVLGPASTLAGIGLAAGAFIALLAVFYAIAALLHALQDRSASG